MNPALLKLTKYVHAAADLAEGLERDIKNGKKISADTVLRLSKFISATKLVATMLDEIEAINVKLQ